MQIYQTKTKDKIKNIESDLEERVTISLTDQICGFEVEYECVCVRACLSIPQGNNTVLEFRITFSEPLYILASFLETNEN